MARKRNTSQAGKPRENQSHRARKAKPAGRLLSTKQIHSLLKPPENYEELAEKAVEAWERVRSFVRIPGMNPPALSGLLRRARQRQKLEAAIRDRVELTLKRAQQARMQADDAAWRGVLKVWKFVKPYASENEQVKNAFLFLAEALSRPRAEAEKQLDAEPKAETQPEATQTQQ